MKRILANSLLTILCASCYGVTVTGNVEDIFGDVDIAQRVRFTPQQTPIFEGGRLILDVPRSTGITNGCFTNYLKGGLYLADFGSLAGKPIVIRAPFNDTNTYDFETLAKLGQNGGVVFSTNGWERISSRILRGSGVTFTTNNPGSIYESVTVESTGGGGVEWVEDAGGKAATNLSYLVFTNAAAGNGTLWYALPWGDSLVFAGGQPGEDGVDLENAAMALHTNGLMSVKSLTVGEDLWVTNGSIHTGPDLATAKAAMRADIGFVGTAPGLSNLNGAGIQDLSIPTTALNWDAQEALARAASALTSFQGRTNPAAVLTSADVTGALGYVPWSSSVPVVRSIAGVGTAVTLAWDVYNFTNATPVTNYVVYYGVATGVYTNSVSAGTNTTATVSNLVRGTVYYFSATAVDSDGQESGYSSEVLCALPSLAVDGANIAVGSIPTVALNTNDQHKLSLADADAAAYAATVGLTGEGFERVNSFVTALKADGLWTGCDAYLLRTNFNCGVLRSVAGGHSGTNYGTVGWDGAGLHPNGMNGYSVLPMDIGVSNTLFFIYAGDPTTTASGTLFGAFNLSGTNAGAIYPYNNSVPDYVMRWAISCNGSGESSTNYLGTSSGITNGWFHGHAGANTPYLYPADFRLRMWAMCWDNEGGQSSYIDSAPNLVTSGYTTRLTNGALNAVVLGARLNAAGAAVGFSRVHVQAVFAWPRVLSSNEVWQVQKAAQWLLPGDEREIFIGDSMTAFNGPDSASTGKTAADYWPAVLYGADALGPQCGNPQYSQVTYHDMAVSGTLASYYTPARIAGWYGAYAVGGPVKKLTANVFIGINNLSMQNGPTAFAEVSNVCVTLTSQLGARVRLFALPDVGWSATNAGFTAYYTNSPGRSNFNARARAARGLWHDLVDLDAAFPPGSMETNSVPRLTYEGLHMLAQGQTNLAAQVKAPFRAGQYTGTFAGNHLGDGSRLTNLNSSSLTGTVPDARLSTNVVTNGRAVLSVGSITVGGSVYVTNGLYAGYTPITNAVKNITRPLLYDSTGLEFLHQTHVWSGSDWTATDCYGVGYGALQNNTGANAVGSGVYALQNNTGANAVGSGYCALQNNTGENAVGVGACALQNNTGANAVGSGGSALQNNTGANAVGSGYCALQNNTGENAVGVGYGALQNNTGANAVGSGFRALRYNTGANAVGVGACALQNNTGANAVGSGVSALYNNTGANAVGSGYCALCNNNWPSVTLMGHQNTNVFIVDASTAKTFAAADVNGSNHTITFGAGHGFGSSGKLNLKFSKTAGTNAPTGLTDGTVYQFTVTSTTVLTLAGITDAGSTDFAGKLENSVNITGSSAIGVDANPTIPNQFVAGGANVTNTVLRGAVSVGSVGAGGLLDLFPVSSTSTNLSAVRFWNSNNVAIYARGTNGVDKLIVNWP